MRLTFLGTGTSFGVPVVGCDCATCTSDDPRDRRTRNGALLDLPRGRLLVDAPPELRLQLLRAGVGSVDAIWITHVHADHVHGMDDLRIFSARQKRPLPAYVHARYVDDLTERFRYIFDPSVRPPRGTTKPLVDLLPFDGGEPLTILGQEMVPVEVPHGPATVWGFRAGPLGYVTDAGSLPDAARERLSGVRVLVLSALWSGPSHPTHMTVEEAVEAAAAVGAERTFLIHLTHRVRHRTLLEQLPAGVEPAYDGLTVDIPPFDDAP